ncbi:MAG: hypothetical protein ACTSVI_02625, partial [Promethearchaeota archaeon]
RTIDHILNNFRKKYNPKLIYTGIEGDWTECTAWEADNSNVNVNMIKVLELAIECQKLLKVTCTNLDYNEIRATMITEFNKTIEEGGFWNPDSGFYVHGNDGKGENVHGDKYFESTVNYFAMLWNVATKEKRKEIWKYINSHHDIELPFPVLTNYLPRTGARREQYGKTVTNGDVWMVLGSHAAATRLMDGYQEQGTKMYEAILKYARREGIIHNSIYPKTGKSDDSWDPEMANHGAFFAAFVLGVLGIKLHASGIEFNLNPLVNMTFLETLIYFNSKKVELNLKFEDNKFVEGKITIFPDKIKDEKENMKVKKNLKEINIENDKFLLTRDNEIIYLKKIT